MKHLRDNHLHPNIEVPDVPEVGDIVRVYESSSSEYYILGKVVVFDDDKQEYAIRYVDKDGRTIQTVAKYNRVELESIHQENVRRRGLNGRSSNSIINDYQEDLLDKISQIKDKDILNLLADGAQQRVGRYDEKLTPISKEYAISFQSEVEKLYQKSKIGE